MAALEAVAGRIRWERDPAVERIVSSWPARWDCERARRLGFAGDPDFASIVRAHVEDDAPPTPGG